MRLLSLLEDERKSRASWYIFLRQSPKAGIARIAGRQIFAAVCFLNSSVGIGMPTCGCP
jgi:hypothetical protein